MRPAHTKFGGAMTKILAPANVLSTTPSGGERIHDYKGLRTGEYFVQYNSVRCTPTARVERARKWAVVRTSDLHLRLYAHFNTPEAALVRARQLNVNNRIGV